MKRLMPTTETLKQRCKSISCIGINLCASTILLCLSTSIFAELKSETIPKSLSLPSTYPESWLFVHDNNYYGSLIEKFIILDVGASSKQYKGVLQGALRAAFVESKRHSELYITETLYSKGTYGERSDLLIVYEKENISPIAEIALPGEKRAIMTGHKGALQMTQDEQFVLVFNFTPAASVTVVDMDKRKVVNEVPIPGCSLIYPSGRRGFSTLCANGTLASFSLDKDGQTTSEHISDRFNDIDENVLYMTPAFIKGVAYFPSFLGHIQPVKMSKKVPEILPAWPLISAQERADAWRTADGQTVTADDAGKLYVRVRKVREDGSHQPDSSEVWVFNVKNQKRIARFQMKKEGYAIEITRGKQPFLVVLSADGVDVYNAHDGKFIRNIGGFKGTLGLLHASK